MEKDLKEIEEKIKENQLEQAAKQLISVGEECRFCKSAYKRKSIEEKIKTLKKLYLEKKGALKVQVKARDACEFKNSEEFHGKSTGTVIKDEKNKIYEFFECTELKVENSTGIRLKGVECQFSASFLNVESSEITCSAQQIRLCECKNVVLRNVRVLTDIILERSSGIEVSFAPGSDNGCCETVKDISCPFNSSNYSIIA